MFSQTYRNNLTNLAGESQSTTADRKAYQLIPHYRTIGVLLILVTIILLVSTLGSAKTPMAYPWPDLEARALSSSWWRVMLETSSNAYFPWGPPLLPRPEIWNKALLILGISLVLLPQLGLILALASGLTTTLLLTTCIPHAAVVPWSVASTLPIVFLLLRLSLASPLVIRIFLAFAGGSLAALTINQLSPVFVALAWLLFASKLSQRLAISGANRSHIKPGLIAVSLVVPIAIAVSTPKTIFPDYPEGARLVDNYGVPGFARPLVGISPPTKVIDRVSVKLELRNATRIALGLTLLIVAAVALSERTFALLPIFVGLATLLDILAPEWLAQIGPIQAMSRLMPGMVLFNLAPIALFTAIVLLVIGYPSLPMATASLVASLLLSAFSTSFRLAQSDVETARDEVKEAITNFAATSSLPASQLSSKDRVIFSPSFSVFRRLGTSYPFALQDLSSRPLTRRRVRAATLSTSATTSTTPLKLTTDHNPATRWSPGGGHQEQGSWLKISLPHPEPIAGVVLDLGSFTSDFPRNFRIITERFCPPPQSSYPLAPPQQPTSVQNFTPWRGPLLWTPDGYPYFGPESDVTIIFPKQQETQCITVEITKNYPHFDWSVAEVYLLVRGEAG